MLNYEDEDPIFERERIYQNRSHIKYDYTTVDLDKGQDKGKAPELVTGKDKEVEEFEKISWKLCKIFPRR